MGFIKKILRPKHDCLFPDKEELDAGTIWQCDDCGKVYRLFDVSISSSSLVQPKQLMWQNWSREYYLGK